jgi:methyl coenzyme M reductase subunit C-like uncharacterized protein (methanogenesis marker protein 7)
MSVFGDFMASQAVKSDEEILKLRAEVERLTQLIEQVKQEITEEPTIGRTVDILFREPLEKAEAENRELTATVARLTGERDHERELRKLRWAEVEKLEVALSQAQQALRHQAIRTCMFWVRDKSVTEANYGRMQFLEQDVARTIEKWLAEAALPSDTQGAQAQEAK